MSKDEIDQIIDAAASGNPLGENTKKWDYETITSMKYKTILPYDCYQLNQKTGLYEDVSDIEIMFDDLYEKALELEVVGIIRPSEDSEAAMLSGSIGYTHELTEYYIEKAYESDVVKAQLETPDIDVFTGKPFKSSTSHLTNEEKQTAFKKYVADITDDAKKREIFISIACLEYEIAKPSENENEKPISDLDKMVNETLNGFSDKNMLIEMIVTSMGDVSIDIDKIKEKLNDLTLEELKEKIRPGIVEMAKARIKSGVEQGFAAYTDAQVAAMLDGSMDTYTVE
jgi:putative ABC transport system permease protein